ncbi:MAG TPA: hypothetical protein VKA67_06100, partial [Verrucomicrobiae bacterium]|nr:hypothetical protein [Verrucomicrobiae bacterium]
MEIPVYKYQRTVLEQKARTRTRLVIAACSLLLVAFLGAWIWYAFIGSHPKVVYSQNIPPGDQARFYELLAPHDVLSVYDGEMTLYDAVQQKQLWSTKVNTTSASQASDPDGVAGDSEDASPLSLLRGTFVNESDSDSAPRVVVTANDIWLVFANHIEQHDRQTGRQKQNVALKTPVFGLERHDDSIMAISLTGPARAMVTRIALAAGTVQTEQFGPEQNEPATAGAQSARTQAASAESRQVPKSSFAGSSDSDFTEEYFAAGTGVLQVNIRLLEHKIVTRKAMKPKGKSLVNNQLSANASIEASEQELNDIRREEGSDVVKEDVSRYQVSLLRLPTKGAPEWSGEVIGPPAFYSLKTVNVLAGGQAIDVFDKNGKKLWDAKMTYSL